MTRAQKFGYMIYVHQPVGFEVAIHVLSSWQKYIEESLTAARCLVPASRRAKSEETSTKKPNVEKKFVFTRLARDLLRAGEDGDRVGFSTAPASCFSVPFRRVCVFYYCLHPFASSHNGKRGYAPPPTSWLPPGPRWPLTFTPWLRIWSRAITHDARLAPRIAPSTTCVGVSTTGATSSHTPNKEET